MMGVKASLVLGCAAIFLGLGCASKEPQLGVTQISDATGIVPAPDGSGCGNAWVHNCPDGYECYGSLACDSAPWKCRPKQPTTCIDVLPFLVCDCSGFVTTRASGCPEDRYAKNLEGQFGGAGHQLLEENALQKCDPSRVTPYAMRYHVRGEGFEAYEGATVYWTLAGSGLGVLQGSVRAGVFEGNAGPIENGQRYAVYFFVDADRDGRCGVDADASTAEPGGFATVFSVDLLLSQFDYIVELPTRAPPSGFCRSFAP